MSMLRIFIPSIIHGILSPISLPVAVCASLAASLLSLFKQRFALEWVQCLYAIGSCIMLFIVQRGELLAYTSLAFWLTCSGLAFGSLLGSCPLTVSYARSRVPPSHITSPIFLRVNRAMTCCLGLFFGLESLFKVLRILEIQLPHAAISVTLSIFLAIFIKHFPSWYAGKLQKKHTELVA